MGSLRRVARSTVAPSRTARPAAIATWALRGTRAIRAAAEAGNARTFGGSRLTWRLAQAEPEPRRSRARGATRPRATRAGVTARDTAARTGTMARTTAE